MLSYLLASHVAIAVAGERTAIYWENVAKVSLERTLVAHYWSCYSQWDCKGKRVHIYTCIAEALRTAYMYGEYTYCCGIVDWWEYEWASRWPEAIWTDPPYPGEICDSGTLDRWIKKKYRTFAAIIFINFANFFNAKQSQYAIKFLNKFLMQWQLQYFH